MDLRRIYRIESKLTASCDYSSGHEFGASGLGRWQQDLSVLTYNYELLKEQCRDAQIVYDDLSEETKLLKKVVLDLQELVCRFLISFIHFFL